MSDTSHRIVTIVGLGQIGGSLGLALRAREAAKRVLGVDASELVVQQAAARGAIDDAVELAQGCADADIVVLAVPLAELLRLIPQVAPVLGHRTILTDVGSVKLPVRRAVEAAELRAAFVGGHPLAGTEGSGLGSADPRLFEGAAWVLCPGPHPHPDPLEEMQALVRSVGAVPRMLEEDVHDRVVAATSHLPHGIAAALMLLARTHSPLSWGLAAGSFRSATRVARSDVRMTTEMLWANRENLLRELASFREHLQLVTVALSSSDPTLLEGLLFEAHALAERELSGK